jgi:hypothetical protein
MGDVTEMRADAEKIAVLNLHVRTVHTASSRTHRSRARVAGSKVKRQLDNIS